MNETDDRLFGDPVWELFTNPIDESSAVPRALGLWLTSAAIVAVVCYFSVEAAVILGCLAFAVEDIHRGLTLSRTIPDEAGGTTCALFAYAWGLYKVGMASLAMTFVALFTKVYIEYYKYNFICAPW